MFNYTKFCLKRFSPIDRILSESPWFDSIRIPTRDVLAGTQRFETLLSMRKAFSKEIIEKKGPVRIRAENCALFFEHNLAVAIIGVANFQ